MREISKKIISWVNAEGAEIFAKNAKKFVPRFETKLDKFNSRFETKN